MTGFWSGGGHSLVALSPLNWGFEDISKFTVTELSWIVGCPGGVKELFFGMGEATHHTHTPWNWGSRTLYYICLCL